MSLFAQYTDIPDNNFEQALFDLSYDDVLGDNQVLTANISSISTLSISYKNINDLTGIEDFTALSKLFCNGNAITNLDVSSNINLTELDCHSNDIANLNISGINLTNLNCRSNELINLDISENTNLTELFCYSNNLTSLDVSSNTNISNLNCRNNQITSLDISSNINLFELNCNMNQLTSINITGCTNLNNLQCDWNSITELDLYTNISLTNISCINNNSLTLLNIKNGNNNIITDFYANNNPNLTCIFVDDAAWSTTNWTNVDVASTFVETQTECDALDINDITNNNFSIYPNPTKDNFSINTNNKIENIKVYDVFGKLIKSYNKQASYSVSDLVDGVYLIHIKNEEGIQISRLIIE